MTDNVGVTGVTLYFRRTARPPTPPRDDADDAGNRYVATLEGSPLTRRAGVLHRGDRRRQHGAHRPAGRTLPGRGGRQPGGDRHQPEPRAAARRHEVTIAGTNFKPGATVTFGGAACEASW